MDHNFLAENLPELFIFAGFIVTWTSIVIPWL